MLFDRLPHGRIGRVVDHDHAFEIGIFEPGDRIECRLEHLRRLAAGRNMDRNFGRIASGTSGGEPQAGAAAGRRRWPRSPRCAPARSPPAGSAARCRAPARKRRRARNNGPSRRRRWPRHQAPIILADTGKQEAPASAVAPPMARIGSDNNTPSSTAKPARLM